jgi:hypothetical protein
MAACVTRIAAHSRAKPAKTRKKAVKTGKNRRKPVEIGLFPLTLHRLKSHS